MILSGPHGDLVLVLFFALIHFVVVSEETCPSLRVHNIVYIW